MGRNKYLVDVVVVDCDFICEDKHFRVVFKDYKGNEYIRFYQEDLKVGEKRRIEV